MCLLKKEKKSFRSVAKKGRKCCLKPASCGPKSWQTSPLFMWFLIQVMDVNRYLAICWQTSWSMTPSRWHPSQASVFTAGYWRVRHASWLVKVRVWQHVLVRQHVRAQRQYERLVLYSSRWFIIDQPPYHHNIFRVTWARPLTHHTHIEYNIYNI